MIIVALVGLTANVLSVFLLKAGVVKIGQNIRSAYIHLFSDSLHL